MQLKQLQALRAISIAVIEAVEECGHTGAPAGVLFAVLSAHGCSKIQFDGLMRALVNAGYLRKDGLVYFSTGREIGAAPKPDAWTAAAPSGTPIAPAMPSPRGWDSISGGAQ